MSASANTFPTPAHYELAIRGERALNNAAPLIAKAEACGVDCTQFKEGHDGLRDFIQRFKREFFPDQVVPPTGSGVRTTAE